MKKPNKEKRDPKQFQEYLNSIEESDCITSLIDVSEVYQATDNFTPDQAESLKRRSIFKFTDVSMISRVPENLQDQFEIEHTDVLLTKFTPIDDPKKQPKKKRNHQNLSILRLLETRNVLGFGIYTVKVWKLTK